MPLTRPKAAQVNFDVTNITDPLLRINSSETGSADKDTGIVIERGSDQNVALIYDESADQFAVVNTDETGTTSGNVTISSYAGLQADAIVYGSLNDGTTTLSATVAELNLLDGVTGTLVTESATQTLTNKTITSPTISNPTLTGTYTFTSDATSTPAMTLTANSINDGVGALRIDGSQADIFLNPSTATHTTVTFAVNDDQRLAFGMDNNSDFYITRRTGGSWYDDTLVIDRDTGLLSLGYGATVAGTLTYSTLNDGTTALTSSVAELNHTDGVTSNIQTQIDAKAPIASPTLTGTPAVPTATAGTNTTQIATTAFVSTAVANIVDSAPGTLDTLNELAAALGDDANFSTTVTTSIGEKLAKASNLSDLTNASTARTNLGLGTAATTASTAYATAAQGTTADAALARSGGTITGDVTLSGASILVPDNEAVRFGAGQDLVIFHDGVGGGSYINEAGSGNLFINGQDVVIQKYGTSEVMADFNADGAVQLYYNNLLKLQTTTTGVKISGDATTDAELMLHPGTNTDPVISFQGQSGETTSEGAQIWYDNSVGDFHIVSSYDHANGGIRFHTRQPGHLQEGNERLTISGDGNIGVGIASPTAPLHVYTGSNNPGSIFESDATSGSWMRFKSNQSGAELFKVGTNATGWHVYNDTDANYRISVTNAGNVGIGTTGPGYKLEVNGTIHGSGNITTGGVFSGTATSAQYADLAEIYASDEKYAPGTVLIFGGEQEVTTTTTMADHRVAGVVSTNPAYLMNSDAEGVAVALRGRIPCFVEGPVHKGDIIVSGVKAGTGVALTKDSALPNAVCVVGKAIEENLETAIKLVEVVV